MPGWEIKNEISALHRLRRVDIKLTAAMFARAFQEDPLYAFLIPHEVERKKILPSFFAFRLRFGLLYGEVYAVSPLLEGAAIWFSSENSAMTPLRILRAGGFSLLRHAGREVMGKLNQLEEYATQVRSRCVPTVYWHLSPIAVDPLHQGKGFASKLLNPMLSRLEAEKQPCFLETQSDKNAAIYQHYGFRMMEVGVIPGTSIPHYAMLRSV